MRATLCVLRLAEVEERVPSVGLVGPCPALPAIGPSSVSSRLTPRGRATLRSTARAAPLRTRSRRGIDRALELAHVRRRTSGRGSRRRLQRRMDLERRSPPAQPTNAATTRRPSGVASPSAATTVRLRRLGDEQERVGPGVGRRARIPARNIRRRPRRQIAAADADDVRHARRRRRRRRQAASCAPVPAAATIPTAPGRTTLAKPSPTPPSIAVPHPGPMTSRPSSRAAPLELHLVLDADVVGEEEHVHPASTAPGGPRAWRTRPGPRRGRRSRRDSARRPAARERGATASRGAALPRARETAPLGRAQRAVAQRPSRRRPRSRGRPASPPPRAPSAASAARFAGVPIATSHAAHAVAARAARARCPSAARCRRTGWARPGRASSCGGHRGRRPRVHRRAVRVAARPACRPRRRARRRSRVGDVTIARRRSSPAKRAADSIFGPMLPGGNSPRSSRARASETVRRAMSRCQRVPKSSATHVDAGESTARSASTSRPARRRRGPCRSPPRCRSRPAPRPRPGCRRRRAAMTSTPAATSPRSESNSTISLGRGLGTIRRQPRPASGATSSRARGQARAPRLVVEAADRLRRRPANAGSSAATRTRVSIVTVGAIGSTSLERRLEQVAELPLGHRDQDVERQRGASGSPTALLEVRARRPAGRCRA